jgi:uncharacterized protein
MPARLPGWEIGIALQNPISTIGLILPSRLGVTILDLNSDTIIQALGLVFAGIVKGISGFAFGLLAVALLVSFYSPKVVIPALLIIYFFSTAMLVYEHRRGITRDFLKSNPLFLPSSLAIAVAALPLGSLLLRRASAAQVSISLGVIISMVSLYYVGQEIRERRSYDMESPAVVPNDSRTSCYVASFMAGLLEGFLGLGGPPLVIYMLTKKYDKFLFVLSFSMFFLILSPVRLFIYIYMDFFNVAVLNLFAFALIFVVIGLAFGIVVRRRFVGEKLFRQITIVLLFLVGLNLILKHV